MGSSIFEVIGNSWRMLLFRLHRERFFGFLKKGGFHFFLWFLSYVLLKFNVQKENPFIESIQITVLAVVPSYLHFYIFQTYFKKLLYVQYTLAVMLLLVLLSFFESILLEDSSLYGTGFNDLFISNLLVIVLSMGCFFTIEGTSKKEYRTNLKKDRLRNELNVLYAQVSPHFLFNALNDLYAMYTLGHDKLSENIRELKVLMDYVLENVNKQKILLVSEVRFIESNVSLFSKSKKRRLQVEFHKEGLSNSIEIAPYIFSPLVENALKHGSFDKKENRIFIFLEVSESEIHFMVENPFGNERKGNKEGTGLVNLRKRLDFHYGENYTLSLKKDKNVFRANLKLAL